MRIPNALREAAKVDGAHELKIFIRIYLPTVTAGIAALSVLMFVQTWNDYLWQLIQLTKDELKTIQLGVAGLQSEHHPDYGLIMAGAVCQRALRKVSFSCCSKNILPRELPWAR